MSITVQWHDPEETILVLHLNKGWSWADLKTALTQSYEMVTLRQNDIYMIFLPQPGTGIPPGNPLPLMRYTGRIRPENVVANISVNAPTLMRSLYETYQRIRSRKDSTYFVESFDVALAMVDQHKAGHVVVRSAGML